MKAQVASPADLEMLFCIQITSALPLSLNVTNSSGSAMKLGLHNREPIASYWKEFAAISEYKVLLPNDTKGVCLLTKAGDRAVGGIYRPRNPQEHWS